MVSLAGLESLERVGAHVRLIDNAQLSDVSALTHLDSINTTPNGAFPGALYIHGNPLLSKCDATDLANALGTTCTASSRWEVCTDVCTCSGNLNDVECP